MYIKEAIQNILDKNLDEMKNNFQSALMEKAVVQLEEKKIKIAQGYFAEEKGQSPGSKARAPRTPGEAGMRSDDNDDDEKKGKSPASKGIDAAKEDEESREKHMKKYGKLPSRLTGELAVKFMKRKKK